MTDYIKHLILLCLMLVGIAPASAQGNELQIPDVTARAGRSFGLPVKLDNTADVVAVEFNLTLPAGILPAGEPVVSTSRAPGMGVVMQPVAGGAYKVMMYSMSNTPVSGRSGTILTIPLAVGDLPEGSSHKLSMSDVVLAAPDGSNILTGFSSGSVTIAKSPDMAMGAIHVGASEVMPLSSFELQWEVSNVGGLPTEAGWRESIYLVSDNGESSLLTSARSEARLAPGETAARMARVNIPQAVGVDGPCRVQVVLTPFDGNGEPETLRDNNTRLSTDIVKVGTKLFVAPTMLTIIEKDNKTSYITVTRSGSRSKDESFTLETGELDARLSLPRTFVIPAGESSVKVPIHIKADGKVNELDAFKATFGNAKYTPAYVDVTVADDTAPRLTLSADRDEIAEGEELIFTVTSDKRLARDFQVRLSTDHSARLSIPATVTIPAGETKATFRVLLPANNVPEAQVEAQISASANGYYSGTFLLTVLDDDTPALTLRLSSPGVGEDAGVTALTGYVSRDSHLDQPLTIELSDDSEGALHYPARRVFMKAGEKEVKFEFGPVDNLTSEGDRTYTVYAGVLLSGCSCTPSLTSPVGTASAQVEIYDNDGPALTLLSDSQVVGEGRSVRMTLMRNTPATSALTVRVTADPAGRVTFPQTVTIPKGETQTTFTVTVPTNTEVGDETKVSLTVEAEGHSKSSTSLLITDRSLPDAVVKSMTTNSGIKAGEKGEVTVTVANRGTYTLPDLTEVALYDASGDEWLGSAWLQEPVEAGGEATVSITFPTDHKPGSRTLYSRVNPEGKVTELDRSNNTSSRLTFATRAPYSAERVEADDLYLDYGEAVHIYGRAQGDFHEGDMMEIYIINSGVRTAIQTPIDAKGSFETSWTPGPGQMGDFQSGACYPGLGATDGDLWFHVRGMRRTSPASYLKEELITGETVTDKIVFTNPGVAVSDGFKVEVTAPDGITVTAVPSSTILEPKDKITVDLTLTADRATEGSGWEYVYVTASADGVAPITTTVYVYVRDPRARLVADPAELDYTVTRGTKRTVPVTITNYGGGDASDITFSMPSWMSVSPSRIPMMKSGESVTVELTLAPEWGANEAVRTGKIFANCTNGNPLGLPFAIEVVAAGTGMLEVEACDNYTFSLPEHPLLAGAKISLRHPASHRELYSGVTGEDGRWSIELPEGRYLLYGSAPGHQDNNWVITVNPGRTTRQVVTLPIATGVKYDYTVEETTVPDEYEMKTTVKYEVNVPAPQVIIQPLDEMDGDNMRGGDARLIRFMLKNVGLLRADDVRFALPQGVTGWAFESLVPIQPFSLEAGQSMIIPVLITRVDLPAAAFAPAEAKAMAPPTLMAACMAAFEEWYKYWCGTELIENHAAYRFALKTCATAEIGTVLSGLISGGAGGGGGVVGPPYNPGPGTPTVRPETGPGEYIELDPETIWRRSFCNPEMTRRVEAFGNSLLPFTPSGALIGPINTLSDTAIDNNRRRQDPSWNPDLAGDLGSVAQMAGQLAEGGINAHNGNGWRTPISNGLNILQAIAATADLLNYVNRPAEAALASEPDAEPGWVTEFKEESRAMMDEVKAINDLMTEVFGDLAWTNFDYPAISGFVDVVKSEIAKGPAAMNTAAIIAAKPDFISRDMASYFMERLRNTALADESTGNHIDLTRVIDLCAVILSNERRALANGYDDACDAYRAALERYKAYLDMESTSVCASVTMQFKQQMVLTRQAFRGTLTVDNGHTTLPITDFVFTPTVRDSKGDAGTEREFGISYETLTGFQGELDGRDWVLGPQEKGVATVLYVPTRYAAPEEATPWDFGGAISYIDPFTAMRVDVNLNPVTLTVKPSPVLRIDYFVQRDVWGDDPLTPEIEESLDAEFSAIIANVGEGEATDVKVVTYKPEIVDNVKGVPLSFDLTGSSLNGRSANLPVGGTVATEFGDIAPGAFVTGQWWFRSNFLAHATDYKTEYTHVSGNGNPDLSLLESVDVHELIRSVESDEGAVAFMVNDLADALDTPDALYTGTEVLDVTAGIPSVRVVSEKELEVTVTADAAGWIYASVKDPTYGTRSIESVTRKSDGRLLPLRNFWQTDRTLVDGLEARLENRLHLAASQGLSETYRIVFSDRPVSLLEVVEITGVPADGVARTPVRSFGVHFSKSVNAADVPADAIVLTYNGTVIENPEVTVTQTDATTIAVEMGNAFHGTGDYTLTVQCARIKDTDGYTGRTGTKVSWTDVSEGGFRITAKADPVHGGTVTPAESTVPFGEGIALNATAADGWRFVGWETDDTQLSAEPLLTHLATRDLDLTARFVPMTYRVEITASEGGSVSGESGLYDYGTKLTLTATPDEGRTFEGWAIGADTWSEENPLEIIVSGDLTVNARFGGQTSTHRIVVEPGWNWVSSSIGDWTAPDDWTVYKKGNYNFGHAVEKGEALHAGEMYRVYSDNYDVLKVEGTPLEFDRELVIPAERLWEHVPVWVGALTGAPVSLDEIFDPSDLWDGDRIISQRGSAVYYQDHWVGHLDMILPGEGYILLLEGISYEPRTLRLHGRDTGAGVTPEVPERSRKYPHIVPIILQVVDDEGANDLYEVTAMCGDEVRGVGVMQEGVHIIDVSANSGERISFVIRDPRNGWLYTSPDTETTTSVYPHGTMYDPVMIGLTRSVGIDDILAEGRPFNICTVDGIVVKRDAGADDLKDLAPGLYVVEGRTILVK